MSCQVQLDRPEIAHESEHDMSPHTINHRDIKSDWSYLRLHRSAHLYQLSPIGRRRTVPTSLLSSTGFSCAQVVSSAEKPV